MLYYPSNYQINADYINGYMDYKFYPVHSDDDIEMVLYLINLSVLSYFLGKPYGE